MSSSSSSTSSSSVILDLLHEVIVAMACREYGEGRVFIHTDRIGGFKTGHGDNTKEFWRKILEWTSKKTSNELIRVGLVINIQPSAFDKINNMKPVSVDKLKFSDLASVDLSHYDCLYIVGLPSSASSIVTQKIETFVENGGGLVIEYPNRGKENINVLTAIQDIYCYSSERLITSNAYWTIDGGNHYVFDYVAEISFMSTLRQQDFSEDWMILMTNIPNTVTTTTTTSLNQILDFDKTSGSEFVISFISSMQNGIVTLEPGSESTSSSNSESSSSSSGDSSSSSSENINWNICNNIVAEWRMDDNTSTNIVKPQSNDFLITGQFISSTVGINTQNRHVAGKINGALRFDSSLTEYISTPANTLLNFTDGINDLPFAISLWVYPINLTGVHNILVKDATITRNGWSLFSNGMAIYFYVWGWDGANIRRGRYSSNALTLNTWNHIIVNYDGIGSPTPQDGMGLYVSASRVDTTDITDGGTYTTMNNPNSSFYMSYTSSPFEGYIDQVVILDKELSQVEIEAIYNLGRGTIDCEGEYWHTSSSSSSSTEIRSSSSSSSTEIRSSSSSSP